ncbi:MAG TPA: hypothetical protein DCE80_02880 [Ignavibacteriales bacterium]|nr:hypothetical protein [Ignavibacteriales bacterium]
MDDDEFHQCLFEANKKLFTNYFNKKFLPHKDYKKDFNNKYEKCSTLERGNIFLDMTDFLYPLRHHKSGISA